jgi:hypothetical protein
LYRNRFPEQFKEAGGEKAFRSIQVPEERRDFSWLVVVLKGITTQQVYEVCRALFDCDKASDIDFDLLADERSADETYAFWARARQEADNELSGQSALSIKVRGSKTMTLLERLLLELRYFTEEGDHLDRFHVTLCTGSPTPHRNRIPTASFLNEKFFIGWILEEFAMKSNAAREVVI